MNVRFRDIVRKSDLGAVRKILESTGFFHNYEVAVGVELVDEHLAKGSEKSGYYFMFADTPDGNTIGYTCYGPIACTSGSFDLYWIAVHNDFRGKGLGKRLLAETEKAIALVRGRRIYIETSSREIYQSTRRFYEKCGYSVEAVLKDFYAPGDSKFVFVKALDA